jgi:hypothetical protein
MPEEQLPNPEEIAIILPSALRIRQRLGQVSISRQFNEIVVPRLERLGGTALSPESLLSTLTDELTEFADRHMLGIGVLALQRVPQIVDELIDDPEQRAVTLSLWERMVTDEKQRDRGQAQRPHYHYSRPTKVPRKLKKAQRSNHPSSRKRRNF